jgi:hypothetical protein
MDTQTQTNDTEISRTDGYQDELIDGVRSARDHKVAAVNFRTMLVEKFEMGDVVSSDEFEIEYNEDHTIVRWQGGPFEWAKDVMGGSTVGSTEFMRHRESDVFPEVFTENPHVEAFCKSGTAIEFLDA